MGQGFKARFWCIIAERSATSICVHPSVNLEYLKRRRRLEAASMNGDIS
jgi:hypothetical protein